MYKGARWLGIDTISAAGREVKPGDVIAEMPEEEAKARRGFEPVYEGESSRKKKEDKKKEVKEDGVS